MNPFRTFSFDEGTAAILGSVRVDSGGADVFEITLNNKTAMYGVWDQVFDNDGGFYVEIISFGYRSKYNVDNKNTDASEIITGDDENNLKSIICKIFFTIASEKELYPFSISDLNYSGKIEFRPNWIRKI